MDDLRKTKQSTLKIISISLVLILAGALTYVGIRFGFRGEVGVLNKTLPDGIRIEKREGQYELINEKDGYLIKIPNAGRGKIQEVSYWVEGLMYKSNSLPEKIRKALFPETKLHILRDRIENDIYLICFKLKQDISLEKFAKTFHTPKILERKMKIDNLPVIKLMAVNSSLNRYFFKVNSKIYILQMAEYGDDEYTRSIIKNSRWDL